jgi:hypothetical protein
MKAHSFDCKSTDELKMMILDYQEQHFQPNLAVVFCSSTQDVDAIRGVFNTLDIDLIGCTTAGEIVDDHLYEQSIGVMLLSLDRAYYRVFFETYEGQDVGPTALNLGKQAVATFTNPSGIILSGGLTADAELIIESIMQGVGKNFPLYGGTAADDLEMRTTIVFNNTKVSSQGLLLLVFDADYISLQGLAVSGWEPIGGINTITKAEGNIIYTINDERAYDVFIRYFGLSEQDVLISIQTNYPLQIFKKGGCPVLRSPIVVNDKDGTITLSAGVKEGEKFRFSSSPGFDVIDMTISRYQDFQKKVSDADALILFSCKGRHGAFGPLLEDEIRGIFQEWKKPMIGFLSYGEFGATRDGLCEFHNSTCSLAILKEK